MNLGAAIISGALLVNAAAILFAASAVTNYREGGGVCLAIVLAPAGLFLLAFGLLEDKATGAALKRFFTTPTFTAGKDEPAQNEATDPR